MPEQTQYMKPLLVLPEKLNTDLILPRILYQQYLAGAPQFFLTSINFDSHLTLGTAVALQQKAESTTAIPTFSPPEVNTTFIDGITWCVAHPSATQSDLQIALDWACGLGATDCSALQPDGSCFQPNTLLSHASYAFNSYYQQNGNSDIACNFGGTATITKRDPSKNIFLF
jgi:X8 domain